MTSSAPCVADDPRPIDLVDLNTVLARAFFGIADDEVTELCVLPAGKAPPHVAYPKGIEEHVRLMRAGASIPRGTGVYTVPNRIKSAIAARYDAGRWCRADAGRAADHEIDLARLIYIDCDAERPKGISATDAEKAKAYDLSKRVEDFLVSRLGDDHPLARGDSGNGYAIFIAIEPFVPTKETGARIERFLKVLAAKFIVSGAKIDTSVFNPARLVPAFGTVKTKGADAPDRPHRSTHFACRALSVRRIPLEVIA